MACAISPCVLLIGGIFGTIASTVLAIVSCLKSFMTGAFLGSLAFIFISVAMIVMGCINAKKAKLQMITED